MKRRRATPKPKKHKKALMTDDVKLVTPATETTPALPPLIAKKDDGGRIEIRAENGSAGRLEIYLRHPVLAEVVDKMGMGNFSKTQFDEVYGPCLMDYPDPKAKSQGKVVSRPAIYTTTKNFQPGTDFDFTLPPRGVLISNPEALRKGFSLFLELKTPVPHDTLRKWGKMVMDGCADIIVASRPFVMEWVMTEKPVSRM